MKFVEIAPAKINLALHVRARRDDGYHEIETLFAFLRDGDTVTIASSETDSFAVTGPFADGLKGEGGNLVLAARSAFAAEHGPLPPLAITLDKNLPVASGIGGGSADAAATLRGLARFRRIDPATLYGIALTLGSDVPACLSGKSAIGAGRGERLKTIDGLTGTPVLLVNPRVAVSTGSVFRLWDELDRGPLVRDRHGHAAESGGHPGAFAGEFASVNWVAVGARARNDLEHPALQIAPVIGDVLALLNAQIGVTLARMSGSGATCFALFESEAARSAAHAAVVTAHPEWWCLESTLA